MRNNVLQSIRVQNFRVLTDTCQIKIKPITLLFGQNGSGKSTFIESIQFLKYIATNLNNTRTFELNKDINFGMFEDLINSNTREKDIKITLSFSTEEMHREFTEIFKHSLHELPKELSVMLYFAQDGNNKTRFYLRKWEFYDKNLQCSNGISTDNKKENYIKLRNLNFENLKNKKDRNRDEDSFLKNYGWIANLDELGLADLDFINNVIIKNIKEDSLYESRSVLDKEGLDGYPEDLFFLDDNLDINEQEGVLLKEAFERIKSINQDVVSDDLESLIDDLGDFIHIMLYPYYDLIYSLIKNVFNKVHNLSHVRSELPRAFVPGENRNSLQVNQLYNEIQQIYSTRNSKNSGYKKLQDAIRVLNFGDSFIIEENNGIFQAFLISNKAKINIVNASSGFKQVFPILLKIILNAPSGMELLIRELSTIAQQVLIEQPELHLHPKLQSELIKYLVELNPQLNLIIETHSEHIIRKLQLLIAKGLLKHDDVAIYYFSNSKNKTKVKELKLDANGMFIDKWPNGFFDEAADLSYELLKEISKRYN